MRSWASEVVLRRDEECGGRRPAAPTRCCPEAPGCIPTAHCNPGGSSRTKKGARDFWSAWGVQLPGSTHIQVIHGRGGGPCPSPSAGAGWGTKVCGNCMAGCPPPCHAPCAHKTWLTSAYSSTMALSTSSSPSQSRQLSKSTESQAGCEQRVSPEEGSSMALTSHGASTGYSCIGECPCGCRGQS